MSPLYSIAMRIREYLYQKDVFSSTSFEVPVISIGNLTMGGTGKTPMVQYLAKFLQKNGLQPAIISRGYGGSTKERVNIVSAGGKALLDAAYVGDEPRMLADTLPGVFVLTGIVRRLPAAKAVEMGADILLFDDGFQHLAVRRDLDLVLFNADKLAGNSRVFPGGDLREPVRALGRCHAFVLTGINKRNQKRAEQFKGLLEEKFPGRPVFFSENCISGIVRQEKGGKRIPVQREELTGRPGFAFCGIARPEGFQKTLEELEIEPVVFKPLADHHLYTTKVVRQLTAEAKKSGANFFICTEKDLVKLCNFDLHLPLYGVTVEAAPDPDLTSLILQHKSVVRLRS